MPEAKKDNKGSKESTGKKPDGSRHNAVHKSTETGKEKQLVKDDGAQVKQQVSPKPKRNRLHAIMCEPLKTREEIAYDEKLTAFAKIVTQRGPVEIANEFSKVETETRQPPVKTAFDANGARNRYKDVFCADSTRVVLKDEFVPSSGDYIHANRVRTHGGEERFICTQGPYDATIDDFWRMVWQEKCTVVIMLCDVIESGKLTCAQYWPLELDKPMTTHSGFTIKNTEANNVDKAEAQMVRKSRLTLTLGSESMTVVHWHWQHWPDRGLPSSNLLALRLLRRIKKNDKKVVVHCSTGIGRTGTVMGLGMADKVLKAGEDLSMEAVLRELRACRHGSVQTDVQYVFMHRALVHLAVNKQLISDEDAKRFYTPYEEFLKSRGL